MTRADWSALVIHLRTVHFLLVVACVVAVIAYQAGSLSEVTRAHEELQDVLNITNYWELWTQRFAEEQIKHLGNDKPPWPETVVSEIYLPPEELQRMNLTPSHVGWTVKPLYSPMYVSLGVELPLAQKIWPTEIRGHQILFHVYLKDGDSRIFPGGTEAVGAPRLDTLEEFRAFWNGADVIWSFIVTEVSPVVYLVSHGNRVDELHWQSPPLASYATVFLDRGGLGQIRKRCPQEVQDLFLARWASQYHVYFCGPASPFPDQTQAPTLVL